MSAVASLLLLSSIYVVIYIPVSIFWVCIFAFVPPFNKIFYGHLLVCNFVNLPLRHLSHHRVGSHSWTLASRLPTWRRFLRCCTRRCSRSTWVPCRTRWTRLSISGVCPTSAAPFFELSRAALSELTWLELKGPPQAVRVSRCSTKEANAFEANVKETRLTVVGGNVWLHWALSSIG